MGVIASILAWEISHTELLIQESIADFGGVDNGGIEKKITEYFLLGGKLKFPPHQSCDSGYSDRRLHFC